MTLQELVAVLCQVWVVKIYLDIAYIRFGR